MDACFLPIFLFSTFYPSFTRISRVRPESNIPGNPYLIWIQEGFTAEPQEMIRGQTFSEMIRIQARKSELEAESRNFQ